MSIGDSVSMFYNAKPILFERAKAMRKNMTQAEAAVWELLSSKKMLGYRFKPQHPIGIFIADFYGHELKLVIEIDGGIHRSKEQTEYDIGREAEMGRFGIRVIRFKNEEVENDLMQVSKEIQTFCHHLKSVREGSLP
jgi:very-short-patch-repair endonuclease